MGVNPTAGAGGRAKKAAAAQGQMHRLGCVSFLNSKPLIEPLLGREDVAIHFAVPSRLLKLVESGIVSTALMSVVDYQASTHDLWLVPAGMIGCDGPTLTVRLFSKVPASEIRELHADTDSHTSVILAQVILQQRHGATPRLIPLEPSKLENRKTKITPTSMLLIGDKVVNAAPSAAEYPHQLDLGEEWKHLTGLPFVFAMWMMRRDMVDPELARLLAEARRQGAAMTEWLLDRYAADRGWPRELARRYFTEYLRYEVTEPARAGLARFFELATQSGILRAPRRIDYLEINAS